MRYGSDYLILIFDPNIFRCIIYPKHSNLNPNSIKYERFEPIPNHAPLYLKLSYIC